jgi:hypothetical protein
MQHAPVVKDQRLPRHKLDSDFIFRHLQYLGPLSCRCVPQLHGLAVLPLSAGCTVVVVPAYLCQRGGSEMRTPLVSGGERVLMLKDRKAVTERAVVNTADLLVAARMRDHFGHAQYFVEVWVGFVEMGSGSETVHKGRFATRAIGVREEVEQLQAARVGEVGRISVNGEGQGSVRGVRGIDGGSKVPESAILGLSDEGDAVEEGFGR